MALDPLGLEQLGPEMTAAIAQLDKVLQARLADAQTAMAAIVDRAGIQLANNIQGALIGLQAVEDKSSTDIAKIIEGLDGWTVQYTGSFTLTKPKAG